jgi:protein arginine kinase activator
MKCEICKEREARIHVTDLASPPPGPGEPFEWTEQHVCAPCATRLELPHVPTKPQIHELWQLLGQAPRAKRQDQGALCPHCGMTLAEFRAKGRLGCPHDYEVFREHLDPLLERIHNAQDHVGRLPGGQWAEGSAGDPAESEAGAVAENRAEPGAASNPAGNEAPAKAAPTASSSPAPTKAAAVEPIATGSRSKLERELAKAIAAEDYERAAALRDSLRELGAGGA